MRINGLDGKQIEVEDTEAECKSLKEIVVCHISQKKKMLLLLKDISLYKSMKTYVFWQYNIHRT